DSEWIRKERAWTFYNMALRLEAASRFQEAAEQFNKGISLMESLANDFPMSTRYMNALTFMLVTCPAGPVRDAKPPIVLARQMLQMEPASANHLGLLGIAQYETGDYNAAIESLEKSMKLGGNRESINYDYLAMAYQKKGDHQQAQQWFDKASAWF